MELRNIAIIAHVDHGKTTLVDGLLKQSGTFRDNQKVETCVMDSNELERERGITILSKCTSVEWKGVRINIVDTPGHADFGGEVERILSMVDGVILLVDSSEGPMPQTKFVLGKALKVGLKPIVVINKADKPDARVDEVLNEVFDLFVSLNANDEQLDFPVLYASGRNGWAVEDLSEEKKDLSVLFDLILSKVSAPVCYPDQPFSMLATTLEADKFIGRMLTGKIHSGSVKTGDTIKVLTHGNKEVERFRVTKIMAYRGLTRQSLDEAQAGDIVAIAGVAKGTVADTLCDFSVTEAIEAQPIDPPTLVMTFSVNDSPIAGREGDKVTSRMIAERLQKEAEGNIALKITTTPNSDAFEVAGRGELQLGVLIETMRREGFELSISRPRVVFHKDENGNILEPVDEVVVDVDEEFSGTVVEKMGSRRAELIEMIPAQAGNKVRLIFHAPTRGLIGYHSEFLTDTHGTGVMNRSFYAYEPHKGEIEGRRNGVLISSENGTAIAYSLWKLEDRGPMFIDPNVPVYVGMIIGEHTKPNDLEINPCRSKQLTNIRAAGKDEAICLTPPRRISLEEGLSYIQDDELLEVTPKTIRLRKRILDPIQRKRSGIKVG
uniref:Large ribosomal subunit assembly factor BipA n=1 Tax=uncultured Alphaproteobacteria bacterium TaxID=91750 RepID=A0A6M4NQE7_9PROT|nr:GTP-binding protein [uncultured Alphaproteobacteria bacterium]